MTYSAYSLSYYANTWQQFTTAMLATNDPTRQDESCFNFTQTFECVQPATCTSGSYLIAYTPVTFLNYPTISSSFNLSSGSYSLSKPVTFTNKNVTT